MYKKIIFTSLILIFASTSFSQGLHIGIKAGSDIQKITGTSISEGFAYGYHLGAFSEINITKSIGIQPEIYYSAVNLNKGTDLDTIYQSLNISNISKIKFGYFNVPILLNIKPSKHFSIQAGPRFGILYDKNLSVSATTNNALKKGDLSMIAGIQLYFSNLRIYGRYQLGLTSINEAVDSENWKTAVIHVGLALKLL
jgi:hypothetical protein